MKTLTNTSSRPRGLTTVTIAPGASASVADSLLEHEGVKDLIERGILVVEGDTPDDDAGADEKDVLIAALAEYGITKTRRSSVESLQAALDEAKGET